MKSGVYGKENTCRGGQSVIEERRGGRDGRGKEKSLRLGVKASLRD